MKELRITEGLSNSVWKALGKAIDNNNPETVRQFIDFFRHFLATSLQNKKPDYFREYAEFPSFIYLRIIPRVRQNTGEQIALREVADDLSLYLREMIDYYIGFAGKSYTEAEEKHLINQFYYSVFSSFNNLLYSQAQNRDWKTLSNSLKKYSLIGQGIFDQSITGTFEVRRLQESNENGINDRQINQLKSEIESAETFDKYKRQPISALRYWLYLLFDKNILRKPELLGLLKDISKIGTYDPYKEVEDLLFFRTSSLLSYMNWEGWDYIDRPEGELYSPPMPSRWMTRGFVIDRIRTNNAYFETSHIAANLLADIPFLFDAVSEEIGLLKQHFEKWRWVIGVELEEFNSRAINLLSSIALAKRSVIGVKERTIAAAPVSDQLVRGFVQKMGLAWRAQNHIRRIFSYFGNITDVTGQDEVKMKRIGQNIFFEKAKMMFIEGEYHSTIYGVEQIGGNVGRWEDDLFLEVATNAENLIVGTSILDTVSKSIKALNDSGEEVTAILMEPEYLYKDETFSKSDRYSAAHDPALNPDGLYQFVLGTFDNVPIFSSHSRKLKNQVLVCNFQSAFLMLHKTNPHWFDNELAVSVREPTAEEVDFKYQTGGDKWRRTDDGIELSEPDAKTLIRTSIVIDVETLVDFIICDSSKFKLGQISEVISD